jgi:hypothetical protein
MKLKGKGKKNKVDLKKKEGGENYVKALFVLRKHFLKK